ncbi:PH domain-containing protein [Streptomyces triticagri]|nr:PH domain-containing protein [Streptomyces triticagri]
MARPDIDAAVKKLPWGMATSHRSQIERLPKALMDGEAVEEIVVGEYGSHRNKHGLLVLTSARLLLVRSGLVNQEIEEFHFNRISSVELKAGFTDTVTIHASGNTAEFKKVPAGSAKALRDRLSMILAQGGTPPPQPEAPASSADVTSRLQTLDQLLAAGVITDAEHQQQRAQVIQSI